MVWDKVETGGIEFGNDALVDLFLSSLGTDNTAYYSILCTTLENQCANGQSISFVGIGLKFMQQEEQHTSIASSHHQQANLAALNPNPFAASNCHNGKSKSKGWEGLWQWQHK